MVVVEKMIQCCREILDIQIYGKSNHQKYTQKLPSVSNIEINTQFILFLLSKKSISSNCIKTTTTTNIKHL